MNLEKKLKHFSNIVFAYVAHVKFQIASFNIWRNVGGDGRDSGDSGGGGDSNGTKNIYIYTSRDFS